MSQSVRHKNGSQVGFHHVVDTSLQQASFSELGQNSYFRRPMHFGPRHTRFQLRNNGYLRFQNSLVDQFLVLTEFPIHRKTAGNITGVTVIFGAHIQQGHVSVL